MKKSAVTMVSVLTVGALLAGCGSGGTTPAASTAPSETPKASTAPTATPAPETKPFTVKLRHILVKESQMKELDRLKGTKANIEKAVPGATLEIEGLEEQVHRWQKLRAEMSSGNPPAIFNLFGGTDVRDFAKTGNLLDLTPILAELGLNDKFYNLSEFTVDGKVYGLPLAGYVEGIFYNKKIFADNNIQIPKTWDELLTAGETLKSKNITPFGMSGKDAWASTMIANTLWVRAGGNTVVEDIQAGTKKWTDVTDGFNKYEELVKKGFFTKNALALSYPESQAEFRTGKVAMYFDGSWAGGSYTDPAQTPIAEHVGFFLLPTTGGPGDNAVNSSFSNGYGFSAKMNEQELKVAKEFIKDVYSQQMQAAQNKEDGWLPSMKYELEGAKPIVKEIMGTTAGKDLFPAFDSLVPSKVNAAIGTTLQEVLGGRITGAEAAEKVQKVQEEADKEKAAGKK